VRVERRVPRIAAIVAGLALALALAGCGGGGDSATTSTAAPIDATGTTVSGDVAAGRDVFISTGCGSCHTLEEAGTDGAVGPNLDTEVTISLEAAGAQLEDFLRSSIVDPDSFVMPQFSGGVMPSDYGDQLSEQQLDDLVAFLVSAVG
jgi:mono/diheme cytochrome c family protein